MKITLAATVAALMALGLMLARTSPEPQVSGQSRDGPVDAPPSGSLRAAPGAPAAPFEGNAPSQPQGGARLPRSEAASSDAPNAAMASAGAALPPPDGQAALQQLVVQSRQENEQLGQIDNQLAALRLQAYEEEWRRQAAAEQEEAQRAATLQALDTLRYAERMLATGNSDGVDDELANAEAALSGRTRLDVETAREALENEDLYPARQYLAAALAERRVPR
jgi:hypothetical protein